MIAVYSWDEAPEELKALSDHGGDEEQVIVAIGLADIEAIMKIRDMFVTVVHALDVWNGGCGTEHQSTFKGKPCIVYITAHA